MAAYSEDQILQSSDPVLSESNALVRLTAAEAASTATDAQVALNTAAVAAAAPLTTKGDVMGFTTVPARLAVGSDGQALVADSGEATGLKWATADHSSLDVAVVVTGASGAVTIQAKDSAGANLAAAIPVEVVVWKNALGVLADGVAEAGMTVSTGTEDALNDGTYASRKLITTDATGLIELSVEEKAGAAITFVLQVINRAGGSSPALAAVAFAGP